MQKSPLHPFSATIMAWYAEHQRELPWRQTKDPYAIWLSEIILQQTRVAQGLPYHEWLIAFEQVPENLEQLAKEIDKQILRNLGIEPDRNKRRKNNKIRRAPLNNIS